MLPVEGLLPEMVMSEKVIPIGTGKKQEIQETDKLLKIIIDAIVLEIRHQGILNLIGRDRMNEQQQTEIVESVLIKTVDNQI